HLDTWLDQKTEKYEQRRQANHPKGKSSDPLPHRAAVSVRDIRLDEIPFRQFVSNLHCSGFRQKEDAQSNDSSVHAASQIVTTRRARQLRHYESAGKLSALRPNLDKKLN